MNAEQKQQILESIKSTLSSYGIPVEELKLKKVEDELKIIPIGYLDLEKYKENFPETNIELFYNVEMLGTNRNTEFLVTWKSKEDQNEEALEEIRKIEPKIDMILEKALNDAKDLVLKKEFSSMGERIPSKIRKNYEIGDDLSSIRTWKAKVYLANSKGEGDADEGEMGEVGYTMIEVDTGEMIPIARSDEHHMGYDLIHELVRKKLIPNGNYYPIFFAQNYIYGEYPDQVKKALKAFKIWRDNGGPNTVLTNTGNSDIPQFTVTMDDFLAMDGKLNIATGELFPIGKRVVRYLEKAATLVKDHHSGKSVKLDKVADYSDLIVKELYDSHKFFTEVKALKAAVEQFRSDGQIKTLEQALFAHNGFKNEIHMKLRKANKPKADRWDRRDLEGIFGDLEFAEREFNRLALI